MLHIVFNQPTLFWLLIIYVSQCHKFCFSWNTVISFNIISIFLYSILNLGALFHLLNLNSSHTVKLHFKQKLNYSWQSRASLLLPCGVTQKFFHSKWFSMERFFGSSPFCVPLGSQWLIWHYRWADSLLKMFQIYPSSSSDHFKDKNLLNSLMKLKKIQYNLLEIYLISSSL